MICLSNDCNDYYINLFAASGNFPVHNFSYDFGNEEILLRGLGKKILIKKCIANNHPFYYMDSGYIGNWGTRKKKFFRIVKNNLQHDKILERPADRFKKLKYQIQQPKKAGTHILVAVPSKKPCKFYNINLTNWIDSTIKTLKKFTDRPIKIREKTNRNERLANPIFNDFKDCHALVTMQSIAAIEAILYGIPAFTSHDTAANGLSNRDLEKIEQPYFPNQDLVYKWACHLAYGQFKEDELRDGTALKILRETYE